MQAVPAPVAVEQAKLTAHERLSPDMPFARFGYQIFKGDRTEFLALKKMVAGYLAERLSVYGESVTSDFRLEDYHKVFAERPSKHHEFIAAISRTIPPACVSVENPFIQRVLREASVCFSAEANVYHKKIEFRVVRPGASDNNGLHRDHWFPYFRPLVNVYVPLAGSHWNSAMKIVPESHLWSDELVVPTFPYEGGKTLNKEGVAFSTPVIKTCAFEISEHRPDVSESDFMLFSPLLIHGGGDNKGRDTRFSLEIRLVLG